MKKLYTFTDENGVVLEEVIAETHQEAVSKSSHSEVTAQTDFYSETLAQSRLY